MIAVLLVATLANGPVVGPPIKGVVHDAAKPTTSLIEQAQRMGYQPCPTEDSVGPCYWDAHNRGNGIGYSFVVTDDGEVFYQR